MSEETEDENTAYRITPKGVILVGIGKYDDEGKRIAQAIHDALAKSISVGNKGIISVDGKLTYVEFSTENK